MDEDNINRFETRAQRRTERVSRVTNINTETPFGEVNWEDNHERYNEMIMDAFGMGMGEDLRNTCKTNWAVVVKTKPRGRLETELPETSEPFQVDVPNPARPVPETKPPITLVNPLVNDDVVLVQLSNRLGEDEENEEPHGDTEEEEFIDDDISSSEPEEEPILPDSD
ncbi:hypothetical protein PIB30_043339 [Stylosanthes scabra]|uniref:Uncharacterized protein n=1 Tax=Stylosanthes scabra TaxID=79078 RepID=A0ABU6UGT5_9FABA|nr:hypothetical protein [Stylosanthes scabra]